MGKKAWLIFSIICVLMVVSVLLLIILLVPITPYVDVEVGGYEAIAKQEYTFNDTINTLEKQHSVTSSDVEKGKKADKYEEGNINPFTPKKDVTIYNEPTLNNDKNNGSTNLTPDSK